MRTASVVAAAAAMVIAGGTLLCVIAPGALAQEPEPPPPPGLPFAAHASITVQNSSPLPQLVSGTNVPPFELGPHQHARLEMSVTPPPPPPGDRMIPVRFVYSIGTAPGPECRGAINMTVTARGTAFSENEATRCLARSLGSGGASCHIAVKAHGNVCEGGLAFVVP